MKTRYAREIGPFRTSGVNPRPAPAVAPVGAEGVAVSLGGSSRSQRVQARVDAAPGVVLGDPPRVPAETAVVAVYLEGHRVGVPLDWGLSLSSARGRDALYLREPNGTLHVLVIDADGRLRELLNLPDDLVQDLLRKHFPRVGR